jgi:hypothetical protein
MSAVALKAEVNRSTWICRDEPAAPALRPARPPRPDSERLVDSLNPKMACVAGED